MLLHIIYLIAISAEAMTGALSAGRRHMDLFGVIIIACVTALGGGTLRDMVLGHYPLGWVAHPEYLLLTMGAALFTTVIAPVMHRLRQPFLMLDALGLVAFTLIGCAIARDAGHAPVIAVVAGMLTGVFGGVMRDVLCNEIPLVFRKELYAVVSLATGSAYLLLLYWGVSDDLSVLLCLAGGFALRMTAIARGWRIPTFVYDDDSAH